MNPYTLLRRLDVYSNPWIHVREDEVRRPEGDVAFFGILDMKAGSSVLAVDARREVYLVREFKYAVGRETVEVISGGIEAGELPEVAARRELKEEAGLEAAEWIDMGRIDPFTSVVSSPNYLFMALNVSEGERQPDKGEVLHVEKVPFARAWAMVESGEITHGASVTLILKAERYFAR